MTPPVTNRQDRPADAPAVADVCVRTGYEGGDSRQRYPDTDLLPNLFALPYAALEPDLTFVADDGTRPVGYIVGTADTPTFVRRFRDEWLPTLVDRYPARTRPPATPGEEMVVLMHTPERMILPELAGYPAHLHIDLLLEYQRAGHGRALMTRLLAALAAKGVPAVHLGMVTANAAARKFYDRMGFHEIPVPDPGPLVYLGRATS
jgi:ribosomal protein S18 acetylase RimI-like enzyme